MTQLPDFAPELIGVKPRGWCHSCPLCGWSMSWSGWYDALVCTKCGFISTLEDILIYEMDIKEE